MNVYKGCETKKNIVIKALYSAFETDFDDGYRSVGETHDFWELVYVKKGKVGITADNRIYTLEKNMMILHAPMEFHRIWNEDGNSPSVAIISFSAEWKNPPKNNIFIMNDTTAVQSVIRKITQSFEMDGRAVVRQKSGCEYDGQIALMRLEELLLSLCINELPHDAEENMIHNNKYAQIVRILNENKDKNLSLNDIAEICNMSVSNLKKVFQKYAGMGIKHYYNQLKAEQAVSYLNDGLSVKETAGKLGFVDQNYFSYFFKNIMGASPTEYIKTKKQGGIM